MFYILEIQENANGQGTVVTPIQAATDINEAKSKYHQILMYAAISSVYRHTCIVVDGSGTYYAKESYLHPALSESEE